MGKSHIMMIHGSWHWGGCFQKVTDKLGLMGYPVSSPDLASHGYSGVPWESIDTMETYIAPIRAILEQASEPVVLVGHSMGGVALTYLAETIPEKIKSLIYLTAFMTSPGKTANDYIFSYAENPVAKSLFSVLIPANGGAGLTLDVSKPDAIRDAFYYDCSDTDVRVAANNAVVTNTTVPNIYTPRTLPQLEKHYITCAQDHAIPYDVQLQMIEAAPGAEIHSMTTSHSPFFSAPDELAAIIDSVARR